MSTGLIVTQSDKDAPPITSGQVRAILDGETWAAVKRGLEESAKGKRVYRGSFAHHVEKKVRKRIILPEFEKLMSEKPGNDVQAALDEDRDDDTPPLLPPQGYDSWLHFAVLNMPTRKIFHEHLWGRQPQWPDGITREDFVTAAKAELSKLSFTRHQRRPLGFFKVEEGDPMVALADSAFAWSDKRTLPELLRSNIPNLRSAARWMKKPCPGLGGKVPARMAKTKQGRIEVKNFLIGIGNGNFQ